MGDYPLIERYRDDDGLETANYFIYGTEGIVAMIQSSSVTMTSMATLETNALRHESKVFDIENGNGRRVSAELFNHTPGTKASYSLRLSVVLGEKEGLAHSIRVKKGDAIRSSLYAK